MPSSIAKMPDSQKYNYLNDMMIHKQL